MALLPLAVEYDIKDLQQWCENRFKGHPKTASSYDGEDESEPSLHMVTLAEKLDLKDLHTYMIDRCARRMAVRSLAYERKSTKNMELHKDTYAEIIK